MSAGIFGVVAGIVVAVAGCNAVEQPWKTVVLVAVLVVAHLATQGV